MEFRCEGLNQNDERKSLIRTKVQEYMSSTQIQVSALSKMKALFHFLDFACSISAEDMSYVRRMLWTVNEVKIIDCKREELPLSFGRIFSNLKVLHLSKDTGGFDHFPEPLLGCITLEELYLNKNSIRQISDRIGDLKLLKRLDISENRLKCLPKGLSSLIKLTHLFLKNNEIYSLHLNPGRKKRDDLLVRLAQRLEVQDRSEWEKIFCPVRNSIVYYNRKTGQATNNEPKFSTTIVDTKEVSSHDGAEWEILSNSQDTGVYYHNHITKTSTEEPPECLDRIGGLTLASFDISDNHLSSLPESFRKMTRLEVIEAARNELKTAELLSSFTRLLKLNLSSNCLQRAPSKLATTLEYLDLSRNELKSFPNMVLQLKSLQFLDLNSNSIECIPCEIGFLESLVHVDFKENPIIDPPYAEMVKTSKNVLWTCRQILKTRQKEGTGPLMQHSSGICFERNDLSSDFRDKLLEMIDEAALSGQGLNFQFMNLNQVPSEAFNTVTITRVDLSNNPLVCVPECLSLPLPHIVCLVMKACEIAEIGRSICQLTNLQHLDLEKNNIQTIEELARLRELRYLNLGQNQIRRLPSSLDLKWLTTLNLDSNKLRNLNEGLGKCCNLQSLSAMNNQLLCVGPSIANISSLRNLRLCRNMIKDISEDIGNLGLKQLSLSFNLIEVLSDDLLCPRLCSTLEILELNGNYLNVLPHSIGNLMKIKVLNLHMNPLESPPVSLLNEGMETTIKYCAARSHVICNLSKKLTSNGFKVKDTGFRSPATNVIIGGHGYLTTDDLCEFDKIVDNIANGKFFYKTQPVDDLVQHIKDLRKLRERQYQKNICDAVIDEIQTMYILNEIWQGTFRFFRSDMKHTFSILEENEECYTVPMDQLEIPCIVTTDSENLFLVVKKKLAELDAIYTLKNDDIIKALLDYKSPFGSVAFIKNVKYMDGNSCTVWKESLVIRKVIYSEEEASSKRSEEEMLIQFYKKMTAKIAHWSKEDKGTKSINKEVVCRQRQIIRIRNEAKRSLQKYRSDTIAKMKKMRKMYKTPRDENCKNIEEARKTLEVNIEELEEKYEEAKLISQQMRKLQIRTTAINDMKKKCCHHLYEKVVRNNRALSSRSHLRRPWDDGYQGYKEECRSLKDSNIVLSQKDLNNQLEKVLTLTQFSWDEMEHMHIYDNEVYDKFLGSSREDI